MITKFKLYEKLDVGKPKLGDYVICYDKDDDDGTLGWIKTTIGQIIKTHNNPPCIFDVKYENIPEDIKYRFYNDKFNNIFRPMIIDEILHWSKNKEDLEVFFDIDKYNL